MNDSDTIYRISPPSRQGKENRWDYPRITGEMRNMLGHLGYKFITSRIKTENKRDALEFIDFQIKNSRGKKVSLPIKVKKYFSSEGLTIKEVQP